MSPQGIIGVTLLLTSISKCKFWRSYLFGWSDEWSGDGLHIPLSLQYVLIPSIAL